MPSSAVSLAIILTATTAAAQDREAARRHFDRAEALYGEERFAEAHEEYEAAYDAAPLPAFLFNMGQCQRKLGNAGRALELYRQYLEEAPTAPNRAVVEELVAEVEETLASQEPDDLESASALDEPDDSIPESATDEPESEETLPSPAESAPEAGPTIGLPTWIAAGGSVVLLGVGVYFALEASSAQSDLDDPDLVCSRSIERCKSIVEDGDRAALLRNTFLGVGAAALVATGLLLYLDLSAESEEGGRVSLAPRLGPGALVLDGRVKW